MSDHYFLNVRGAGYTVARVDDRVETGLDLDDSGNFESAYRHLAGLLSRDGAVGPYLCVMRTRVDAPPVVAYGLRVAAADERRRPGLVFLHGIEAPADRLHVAVLVLLGALTRRAMRDLEQQLGEVAASSSASPRDFLRSRTASLASSVHEAAMTWSIPPPGGTEAPAIRSVTCELTLRGMGWLTMVISHTRASGPWELTEQASVGGSTILSSHEAATTDLPLWTVIPPAIVTWNLYAGAVRTACALRNAVTEVDGIESTAPSEDAGHQRILPTRGVVARVDESGCSDGRLSLYDERAAYMLRAFDCVEGQRYEDYYKFATKRFSWLQFRGSLRTFWIPIRGTPSSSRELLDGFLQQVLAATKHWAR